MARFRWVLGHLRVRESVGVNSFGRPFCDATLREFSLTAIQHQHDGMDGRLDVVVSWLECTSGHRLHGRSCFDICSRRCACRMAREPSLLGFHGAVPSFLGHARWFLAGP